jgi:hypothetical protein
MRINCFGPSFSYVSVTINDHLGCLGPAESICGIMPDRNDLQEKGKRLIG